VEDELILSNIIGEIYDCALDPGLWSSALADIAKYINTKAAIINVVCPIPGQKPIQSIFDFGLPDTAGKIYFEKYAKIDPMIHAGKLYDTDEVFTAR
jgi:hypothetical protein